MWKGKKAPAKKTPTLLSCPFCGQSFEDVTLHLDLCPGQGGGGGGGSAPATPTPTPADSPPVSTRDESQTPPPGVAASKKPLPPIPSGGTTPTPMRKLPDTTPEPERPTPPPKPSTPTVAQHHSPVPEVREKPQSSVQLPTPPRKLPPEPLPEEVEEEQQRKKGSHRSKRKHGKKKKDGSEDSSGGRRSEDDDQDDSSIDNASPEKNHGWGAIKPTLKGDRRSTFLQHTQEEHAQSAADSAKSGNDDDNDLDSAQEWWATVVYDFEPQNEGELSAKAGDMVQVLDATTEEWYYVRNFSNELVGYIPADYVETVYDNEETATEDDEKEEKTHESAPVENRVSARPRGPTTSSPGLRPVSLKSASSSKSKSKLSTLRFGSKKKKQQEFTISRSETTPVVTVQPSSSPTTPVIARSETVPQVQIPEETGPPVDQRTKIAREILSTEKHYVRVIKTLETEYKVILRNKKDTFGKEINDKTIDDIFGVLYMMLPINENLLSDLEKVLDGWNEQSCLGDIFVRVAPFLKMYTTYSNHYDDALITLNRCMKNERFAQAVEDIDSRFSLGSRLEGLLIAPVQRIPRYSLLVSELLKHTAEGHPDKDNLSKALPLLQEVGDYINTNMTQTENQQKLLDLSMKGAKSLLKPHRVLLREGVVDEKKEKKMHIWLFNDIIVHIPEGKAKNKNLLNRPEYQWPLHLIWLGPPKTLKKKNLVSFEVVGPCSTYQFTTLEETDKWWDWIKNAAEQHYDYLKQTQDTSLKSEKEANMSFNSDTRFGQFVFPTMQEYIGWWKNGKMHGKGLYKFLGSVFEGDFVDNLRSGTGAMRFCNGDEYNGEWAEDRQNGKGVMKCFSGDTYVGMWKAGKKHGKGEYISVNGSKYVGDFLDDLPEGLGEMCYRDGTVYNGNWQGGMRYHYGIQCFPDGSRYEGEWVAGIRHGKGRMEFPDGSSYDGWWKDGLYHGQGKFDSKLLTYDGEWVAGLKEGSGTMAYFDGVEYKGQFKRNFFHGQGTLTFPDGQGFIKKFEGVWVNHKRHGPGVIHFSNGDLYEGGFKENIQHGSGSYTWEGGANLKCKWQRSKPSGDCVFTCVVGDSKESYHGALKDGAIVSSDRPPLFIPSTLCSDIEILYS